VADIKFCGMTRPEDVREAAALGAKYIGVILAESPRRVSAEAAKRVFEAAPKGTHRVAVFGISDAKQIAETAVQIGADVAQLHSDPTEQTVAEVRALWPGQVWAVARVQGASLPDSAAALFDAADAVVLDARVEGKLGGTGVTLAWDELAAKLKGVRGKRGQVALAGGLSPENVARAIATLNPDIVDVSSGVESSIGVKDHRRMRAFRDAVRGDSR
jgi:phosphoribosylanthranilate isomerase